MIFATSLTRSKTIVKQGIHCAFEPNNEVPVKHVMFIIPVN